MATCAAAEPAAAGVGTGRRAPQGPPTHVPPGPDRRLPPPPPRRSPRSDPGGLVAGLVIAGLGLFFLAGQVEPDIGRFVTLFIGLALLAVFVVRREYGFLVPGSLLTGIGIGIALEPATNGDIESGVMMLSIAGGFLGIWVLGSLYRLPQNHWWPLIPGRHPDAHRARPDEPHRRGGCAAPVAHHPHRPWRARLGKVYRPPLLRSAPGPTGSRPGSDGGRRRSTVRQARGTRS